jgi:hypothetical protein
MKEGEESTFTSTDKLSNTFFNLLLLIKWINL